MQKKKSNKIIGVILKAVVFALTVAVISEYSLSINQTLSGILIALSVAFFLGILYDEYIQDNFKQNYHMFLLLFCLLVPAAVLWVAVSLGYSLSAGQSTWLQSFFEAGFGIILFGLYLTYTRPIVSKIEKIFMKKTKVKNYGK
jgi:hypothetical protein